jgi:hypothetical protein
MASFVLRCVVAEAVADAVEERTYLVPFAHAVDGSVMGCTRDRNVERGTKGFRVRKTGLSSTLVKLRYDQ